MRKRLLACVLALAMAVTLLPMSVFAAEGATDPAVKYGTYDKNNTWTETPNGTGTVTDGLPAGVTSISKTATPTGVANQYNVKLEVKMEQTTETTPPGAAATVLVMDHSGSMKDCATCGETNFHKNTCKYYKEWDFNQFNRVTTEQSRMAASMEATKSFIKTYSGRFDADGKETTTENLNLGRWVCLVWFNKTGGTTGGSQWVDVSNKSGYAAAINMNGWKAQGGTNLACGLRLAEDWLTNDKVKDIAKKNVIVLTDGQPTYYLNTTKNGNKGQITIGSTTYYTHGDGTYCDVDTYNRTQDFARELRKLAPVYTVCFGVADQKMQKKWNEHWDITVGHYLKTCIATEGIKGATYAYDAADADQLNKVFAAISSSVVTGLNAGTVTDSLPAAVSAVPDSGFVENWELKPDEATKTAQGNTITYTWTKTYTVTIDPSKVTEAGTGATYQPLNNVTTLTVDKNQKAFFPIPAGKVTWPTFTVTYDWSGLDGVDFDEGKAPTKPTAASGLKENETYTVDTKYTSASTVTAKDATVYTFTGWQVSTPTSGTTITGGKITMPASNVTLTGTWVKQGAATYDLSNKIYKTLTLGDGVAVDDIGTQTFTVSVAPTTGAAFTGIATITKDNYENGAAFVFGANSTLTFNEAVTYVYTVKEVPPTDPGNVTYDSSTYTLTIKVAKKATGNDLEIESAGVSKVGDSLFQTKDGRIPFTNTLNKPDPDTGTLTVTKTFSGITKDEIPSAFAITLSGDGVQTYTLKLQGAEGGFGAIQGVLAPTSTNQDGLTYTWSLPNIPTGAYTVSEQSADVDGYKVTTKYTVGDAESSTVTVTKDQPVAVSIVNTYESTSTTGTLTITKDIGDNSFNYYLNRDVYEKMQEEVEAAANGKTFTFTVKGVTNNVVKTGSITYNSADETKNAVSFDLPAGDYTVTETSYPLVLGFDATTNLFKWSYAGTSYSINTQSSTGVVTVEPDGQTYLLCSNQYDSWKDGIGKSATNLDGNYISNVTLTLTGQQFTVAKEIDNNVVSPTEVDPDDYTYVPDNSQIVYSIPAGAQLKDVMGYTADYNFALVDISKMTVTVTEPDGTGTKTTTYEAVKSSDNHYVFGKQLLGNNYGTHQYEVTYTPANDGTEHFVWRTNVDIPEGTTVQINYAVKLVSPKSASGTHGQYDQFGQHDYASLLTNSSAILYVTDREDEDGNLIPDLLATFPQPTVSYTISGGGGGGGSSRPVLNTEDHYGYIIGYPDGTVQPGGSITRAEVATIFFRMLTDSSRTEYWSQTNSFSDVPSTAWFNNAVSTLTKAGIIAGYEDGTFQPNATITRAEFATIAVRFFDASYTGKDFFTDIDGHWAQKYINDAANAGLVNGYEDGTFGPNKAITRAEAMTLVNRALDRHPDADHFLKDMVTWPDNSDTKAWYYEAVQEATNSHEYTMKTNTDKTKYEDWTKMLKMRDWKAFEDAWSNANSASNPGEVVSK